VRFVSAKFADAAFDGIRFFVLLNNHAQILWV